MATVTHGARSEIGAERFGAARIGLVEDNDLDVFALRRAFSAIGTIERWPTGEDFRDAMVRDPHALAGLDLLLVDLHLPQMDGVAVVRTARSLPGGRALPIVVLTGSDAELDILRALDAEATEYEVKPGSVAELRVIAARCQTLLT